MSAKVIELSQRQSVSSNESAATQRLSKAQILSILPVRKDDINAEPARLSSLKTELKQVARRVEDCIDELQPETGFNCQHRIDDLKMVVVFLRAVVSA